MVINYKCYILIELWEFSEGIDINKITASKKFDIYHYCYF